MGQIYMIYAHVYETISICLYIYTDVCICIYEINEERKIVL